MGSFQSIGKCRGAFSPVEVFFAQFLLELPAPGELAAPEKAINVGSGHQAAENAK